VVVIKKKKKKSKKAAQHPDPQPSDLLSDREDQDNARATQSYDGSPSPAAEEDEPWATTERNDARESVSSYPVSDSDEFRNVWDGDK
jgi:hypothetical protein